MATPPDGAPGVARVPAVAEAAEGVSEEAPCLRAHGATQFLFTVIQANRATREGEWQELIEFYRPPCNR